jgi:D-amino-acid dehydrogenase
MRATASPVDGGWVARGEKAWVTHDGQADFVGSLLLCLAHLRAPFLAGTGVDWADVRDPWVGARPLTPDGLPLIGRTKLDGVHVAGGHGMWGVTFGPVTGKLPAQQIMIGADVPKLLPFDPLRAG